MRKSSPRDIPPPLELECLKALWELGPSQVKDVRRIVTQQRQLAYTTVMTILERLARKGVVGRHKVGRSFVYEPLLGRDHLQELAVKQLLNTFFDGSVDKLLEYLGQLPAGRATFAAAASASGTEVAETVAEEAAEPPQEPPSELDTALL